MSPLAGGPVARTIRCKRWFYVFVSAAEADLALAIVRTGYASKVFGFVWDHAAGALYGSSSSLGPPPGASVASSMIQEGAIARARGFGVDLRVSYTGSAYTIEGRLGPLGFDLSAAATVAPAALTAVARVSPDGPFYGATEKRALLPISGEVRCEGKPSLRLTDGHLGYDLSHGVLPRRTRWRWAFAQGRDTSGEPIAFNLVQGFIGAAECAVWTPDGLFSVSEGVFTGARADEDVRTQAGELALQFREEHAHTERTRLGVIESDFAQRLGTFAGRLRAGERLATVEGLRGVTEDQAVLW